MQDKDTTIWNLIAKLLDDSASEQEKEIVNSWIEESEANRKTFETLKSVGMTKKEFPEVLRDRVSSRVQGAIITSRYNRKLRVWKFAAAASILLFIASGIFLFMNKVVRLDSGNRVEVFCSFGNKSKIVLPDGTLAFLNSGSSLSYPDEFKGKYRQVRLEGEGYFEVAHDSDHPFIVQSGAINIRVFGTRFNVRNYPDNNEIKTTLLEGSIGIYHANDKNYRDPFYLRPDQQAKYDKTSGKLVKLPIDSDLATIWMDGKYLFEKEQFRSIIKQLERNFNIEIVVLSDELNDKVFSGLIDKNKSIFQALDIMKRYNQFDYRLENDTIVIQSK
ncbi:MAG: FecR domain-containing protein [Bacteroidales bacterium]|nr:FecR domain-containing protein [Bacteroidales bacterium]